jgi:hypothetical protein
MERELIVARYNESVQWVEEVPFPATIYNKGPALDLNNPNIDVIDLPNTGREAGTWLEHICKNYDDLADWSYFAQAQPHQVSSELLGRLGIAYRDTTPLTSHYMAHFPSDQVKALDRVEQLEGFEIRWGLADHLGDRSPVTNAIWLNAVWSQFFTGPKPDPWWFGYCGMFAVPRHRIRDRPLAFWLWARDLVNREQYAAEMTPASAWAFEAIWGYLWGDARAYPVRVPIHPEAVVLAAKPCGGCGSKKGPIPVARKS